ETRARAGVPVPPEDEDQIVSQVQPEPAGDLRKPGVGQNIVQVYAGDEYLAKTLPSPFHRIKDLIIGHRCEQPFLGEVRDSDSATLVRRRVVRALRQDQRRLASD